MPFPKRLLIPDEELILDLRPHPVALALPVIVVVAELAVAIWLTATFDFSSWIWWALFLVIFVLYPLRRLIWWLTSNFAVTTERVIHREGFIAKRSMEIPLEAINDVRFDQGIWDRIVGAGTLRDLVGLGVRYQHLQPHPPPGRGPKDDLSPGRDEQEAHVSGRPRGIARRCGARRALGAGRQPRRRRQGAPSTTTELERLAKLRDDGVLTEAEFQAQKARILGQG